MTKTRASSTALARSAGATAAALRQAETRNRAARGHRHRSRPAAGRAARAAGAAARRRSASIAGSKLPPGESAEDLLQAVMPWLAEALGAGASRLRHGPDGAEPSRPAQLPGGAAGGPARPAGVLCTPTSKARRGASKTPIVRCWRRWPQWPRWRWRHGDDACRLAASSLRTHGRNLVDTAAAQKATAEVLQIIGTFDRDPGPVFDKLAR